MGSTSPISFSITSPHQAAPVVDPNSIITSMHSPIILSDDEDGEGNTSVLLSMSPDRRVDARTGSEVPVLSSIGALHEAGPIEDSNPYNAEVVSVISLGDEEDSEDDVSGLLCPHAGCQLRFPDWASFENHAQLPHDKGRCQCPDGDSSMPAHAVYTGLSAAEGVIRALKPDRELRLTKAEE